MISAVGIVGNVEDLGLEALGVKIDRTHVVTDEYAAQALMDCLQLGTLRAPLGWPTRPATKVSWLPI